MEIKSCCAEAQPSRAEFLKQKLANFKNFVEPYCTLDKHKARLQEFTNVDAVMPFLLQALALKKAGALEPALLQFTEEFAPFKDDEVELAFKTKVQRYVAMFCDILVA